MTESGVIKEMLVNIGYKTDEQGQRRYQDSIAGITKGAAVLVASLSGAAIAATAAINKISTDLAGLFYSSQSLHATAAGITALDRAFEDLEGSMAGGSAAFQSFAEKMRTNPLFKGQIEGATGHTFPEGHADEAFIDVVGVFQKRLAEATGKGDRQAVAHINAEFEAVTGVSSKYIDKQFARLKERFGKHLKEIDPSYGGDTEAAKNLRVAINDLGNAFHDLAVKAASPLFKPLKELFEWLAKWIDDNKVYLIGLLKAIWTEIGKAAHDLDVVFGPVLKGAKILWDGLMEVIKENIGTDLTGLKGLHVVLAGILAFVAGGALIRMASMLTLGFAPFGVLAAVLIGILGTLSAINALFGGSSGAQAATLPGGGIGAGAGGSATSLGGAQTYGKQAEAGGDSLIGGVHRGEGSGQLATSAPAPSPAAPGVPGQGTAAGFTAHKDSRSPVATQAYYDALRAKGYSHNAASGLTANAIVESGGNRSIIYLDPATDAGNIDFGTGSQAVGSQQWEGARRSGVKPTLKSQIAHIDEEIRKRGELHGMSKAQLNALLSEREAASAVNWRFNRPQYPAASDDRRQSYSTGFRDTSKYPKPIAPQEPSNMPDSHIPQDLSGSHIPQDSSDNWVKQHFQPPAGKPLGEGRHSSLQVHDSRSVKHETNINVIGGGGDAPRTTEHSNEMASLLGRLQGNSA